MKKILVYGLILGGLFSLNLNIVTAKSVNLTGLTGEVEITYGDINNDGKVNATDLTLLRAYALGKLDLKGNTLKIADVNKDGEVNETDLELMTNYIKNK